MIDARSCSPERREAMKLPDGRALAWSEWGPPGGLPVIFCTGAGMSGSLGFGASYLADLGLRLIAPDRPGLGGSDPDPEKSLLSWAEDVAALLALLKLDRAAAVGFSQGAPFALALAHRGIAQAVSLVSGQDDLGYPALAPLLHPDVAAMVEHARSDPAGFEARFAGMATADGLWDLILGMSGDVDRALYRSEPFGSAYLRALTEGFSQGAAGYARDLRIALEPWPFDVERLDVPVDLWYGSLDTSPVHSPDLGAALERRLPRATRIVSPREGGSILWTGDAGILAMLRGRLS